MKSVLILLTAVPALHEATKQGDIMLDGLVTDMSTIGTVHDQGTLSASVTSDGSEHTSIADGAAELLELRKALAETRTTFKLQANALKNVVAEVNNLESEYSVGNSQFPNIDNEMKKGRLRQDLVKATKVLSRERFDSRSGTGEDLIPIEAPSADELTIERPTVTRWSDDERPARPNHPAAVQPVGRLPEKRFRRAESRLGPKYAMPKVPSDAARAPAKKHRGALRKAEATGKAKHNEEKHKSSHKAAHKARSTTEESEDDDDDENSDDDDDDEEWWSAHEDAAASSAEEADSLASDEEVDEHHKKSRHEPEPRQAGTKLHEHARHERKVDRIMAGHQKASILSEMTKDQKGAEYVSISNGSRIGLQLLFGVLYFALVVRYYPRVAPGTTAPQEAIDLQKVNPVSASLQSSPKICCMSWFCPAPRAAHTFESTDVMNYWFALLCMSCFPCCTLFLTNTCTDLNVRLGGEQMGLIAGLFYAFCCSCCLIAQDAESLDLVVGAKTGFFGMDAVPQARESHSFF
mmetsp:Transcript_87574/g.165049  ORF Transcript_87574/g.165049 Transcript_87574/m.165049 type:complete len:521 (+) Transcript_87574:55-1617(+)